MCIVIDSFFEFYIVVNLMVKNGTESYADSVKIIDDYWYYKAISREFYTKDAHYLMCSGFFVKPQSRLFFNGL